MPKETMDEATKKSLLEIAKEPPLPRKLILTTPQRDSAAEAKNALAEAEKQKATAMAALTALGRHFWRDAGLLPIPPNMNLSPDGTELVEVLQPTEGK